MLASCLVPASAQEDQSIAINTSKSYYGAGETVYLSGSVTGGVQGQLVAIQIKDLTGNLILIRTVQADQNGNFALSFKLPSSDLSGAFSIAASARVNGFPVTATRVISAPVPEFQGAEPALAGGVASLVLYGIFTNRLKRV